LEGVMSGMLKAGYERVATVGVLGLLAERQT
jgi:hypothetical protein